MKLSEYLKAAYGLIKDPKDWTKGNYQSTMEDGKTCYCSIGAMQATGKHNGLYIEAIDSFVVFLKGAKYPGGYAELISFNDGLRHEHWLVAHLWLAVIHNAEIDENEGYSPEYKELLKRSHQLMFKYMYTQKEGGHLLFRDKWHGLMYSQQINEEYYLLAQFNQDPTSVMPCVVTGKLQTKMQNGQWQYQKDGQPIDSLVRFWDERLQIYNEGQKDNKALAIIDGNWYIVGTGPKGGRFNGMGGREFTIKFNDGLEVVTYDLWSGGLIPMEYRDKMPNNAEFVKGQGSNGQAWTHMF